MLRPLLLALAWLLVVPAVAAAQEPRPPLLSQLDGSASCLALSGSKAADSCRSTPGLRAPQAVLASPSGPDVYVSSTKDDRILHFRAHSNGALRYVGCSGAATDCRTARTLRHVSELAMSGDGRWLLALSSDRATLTLLERDGRGRLHPRSCLAGRRNGTPRDCRVAPPLAGAAALALNRNGQAAYVAIRDRHALVALRRKGDRLTVVRLDRGCVVDARYRTSSALHRCRRTRSLGSPGSVAVSSDGRSIYATDSSPGSLAVLRANPRSGAIRLDGCLTNSGAGHCRRTTALAGAADVVVSSEGANVYVVASEDRAVTAFARNGDGSLDQIGCYGAAPRISGLCAPVPAFVGPREIALAPAGDMAYVVDPSSSSITAFDRAWGGDLAPEGPPQGCVSPFAGCETAHGILGAGSVAVAADSQTIYASSDIESTVAAFRAVPRR